MADHVKLIEIQDDWPGWKKDDARLMNENTIKNAKLSGELDTSGARVEGSRQRSDEGPSEFLTSQAVKREAKTEEALALDEFQKSVDAARTLDVVGGGDTSDRRRAIDAAVEGIELPEDDDGAAEGFGQ